MESEGIIDIIDDVKGEVETHNTKDEKDRSKQRGNVKIFDETEVDSDVGESCVEDNERNSNDSQECRHDHDKVQIEKCKVLYTPNDSFTDEESNSDDCVSGTYDDNSNNKNCKEKVCTNGNSDSEQPECKTVLVKAKQLLPYETEEEGNRAYGKSEDNLHAAMTRSKNCTTDFDDVIEDLSSKDFKSEKPLEDQDNFSNKESYHKAEIKNFNPFHIELEKTSFEPGNTSVSSVEKASDNCTDLCEFCQNPAMFTCTICKYLYCTECQTSLHPNRGPYKSHNVIPLDGGVVIDHPGRCDDHGLAAQLFCSYCEQKRCAECANTKCLLHFKGKVSGADIEKEKTLLVEELERATTKLAFLGRYKDMVEREFDQVEMTGLLRKEQVRQEFVSFHELLINKEAEILEFLDQDVEERMNHIRDTLQSSVIALEREDALLTTTVTELVQSENDAQFIEDCVSAKELCKEAGAKIRKFNRDWAMNSVYKRSQILDYPFSMFLEKKQLLEKLDAAVYTVPEVQFNQTTLFLGIDSGPLNILDYLQVPFAPTSTDVQYTLQLSVHGKVVYEEEIVDMKGTTLNTDGTIKFVSGKRYLLKICPTFKYFLNSTDHVVEKGKSAHMLIVVENDIKGKGKIVSRSPKLFRGRNSRFKKTLKLSSKQQTFALERKHTISSVEDRDESSDETKSEKEDTCTLERKMYGLSKLANTVTNACVIKKANRKRRR